MMGIAKNAVNVLGKTIKYWMAPLTCGAEIFGEEAYK